MSEPTPKPDERRLHPSALVIYSADALRNAAFPLLVILAVTLLGGPLDTRALVQAAIYGGIGLVIAVSVGAIKFQTTSYYIGPEAIHHLTGALSKKVTDIRLDRIQAIDVHQGPLQRAFGVFSVDIQTGAGKKGGEISLPALTPAAVEELRAARPQATAPSPVDAPAGPTQRVARRDLLIAAVTAGQLGIILPVLAGAGQIVQQLFEERRGEDAVRALPHSALAIVLIAGRPGGARVAALDRGRARHLRRLHRDPRRRAAEDPARLRLARRGDGAGLARARRAGRRGDLPAPVRPGVADDRGHRLCRRGRGRAHAVPDRPRARRRGLPVDGSCPSWPTIRAASPRRRRGPPAGTCCCRSLAGAAVTGGAWFVVGAFAPLALVVGVAYGHARWRAAAWRLADGRLAVRSMRLARTTVLAPARFRESHTLAQNVLQRRAGLADLEVAFGKQTTARIRHLEAADARAAWSAL